MTWEMLFGIVNTLLTLVAIYLAGVALRVARDALKLEQQARGNALLERRLQALDALGQAVFDLEIKASLVLYSKHPGHEANNARGRNQIALRGCDEDLPVCHQLSEEASLDRVIPLTVHASAEISDKRREIQKEKQGQSLWERGCGCRMVARGRNERRPERMFGPSDLLL
jgi:hypothetical protein